MDGADGTSTDVRPEAEATSQVPVIHNTSNHYLFGGFASLPELKPKKSALLYQEWEQKYLHGLESRDMQKAELQGKAPEFGVRTKPQVFELFHKVPTGWVEKHKDDILALMEDQGAGIAFKEALRRLKDYYGAPQPSDVETMKALRMIKGEDILDYIAKFKRHAKACGSLLPVHQLVLIFQSSLPLTLGHLLWLHFSGLSWEEQTLFAAYDFVEEEHKRQQNATAQASALGIKAPIPFGGATVPAVAHATFLGNDEEDADVQVANVASTGNLCPRCLKPEHVDGVCWIEKPWLAPRGYCPTDFTLRVTYISKLQELARKAVNGDKGARHVSSAAVVQAYEPAEWVWDGQYDEPLPFSAG